MTHTTTNYSWPYPDETDAPDGATQIQNAMVAADSTVHGIDVRLAAAETKLALPPVLHTYSSNTTWTKPGTAGFLGVEVELQAGGGGSGAIPAGTASNGTASGGGQGGQYLRCWIPAASLSSTEAVTIGAAGTAGTAGGGGGSGGDTSFAGLLIARGGAGGAGGITNGSTFAVSLGGAATQTAGGTLTPDYNRPGGDGKNGLRYSGTLSVGGDGGESQMAGSRRTAGISNGGTAGYFPGGGASGGSGQNAGAANGAIGGAGQVIVTEVYS